MTSKRNFANPKTVFSKISVKSQTVLPLEVRERLRLVPGDRLRYTIDDRGVHIDKGNPAEDDDPFAVFSEWGSQEDEEAYANL